MNSKIKMIRPMIDKFILILFCILSSCAVSWLIGHSAITAPTCTMGMPPEVWRRLHSLPQIDRDRIIDKVRNGGDFQ